LIGQLSMETSIETSIATSSSPGSQLAPYPGREFALGNARWWSSHTIHKRPALPSPSPSLPPRHLPKPRWLRPGRGIHTLQDPRTVAPAAVSSTPPYRQDTLLAAPALLARRDSRPAPV